MDSSNGRAVVNNNVLLSSFSSSSRGSGGCSAAQAEVVSVDPSNNVSGRSVDVATDLTAVVAPSAVVSGGMMTLPTPQHQSVNGGGAMASPWQRGQVAPTGGGRGLTRSVGGSCSYGVSSPCCKLLPAASTASSSCHLRSVTLPRGHPATYSGEIAARLRPPPPPSAAAIRQAAQRASLERPAGKTLDARPRSHGRAGSGFKSTAESNTEQRRSVSTVIV